MTLLRRMATAAVVAGLVAGVLLTVLQAVWVTPLLHEAERHEAPQSVAADAPWSPGDGVPRLGFTALSNAVVGVGYALLLSAAMVLAAARPGAPVPDARQGLLWGVGGYVTFVLGPALGVPPELPGMPAADLGARQVWWLAAVLGTGGGLAVLAFAPGRWRWLCLPLLLAPHLFGAPHPAGGGGGEGPPATLAAHYAAAVLATLAPFWAVLGALAGWVSGRPLSLHRT